MQDTLEKRIKKLIGKIVQVNFETELETAACVGVLQEVTDDVIIIKGPLLTHIINRTHTRLISIDSKEDLEGEKHG